MLKLIHVGHINIVSLNCWRKFDTWQSRPSLGYRCIAAEDVPVRTPTTFGRLLATCKLGKYSLGTLDDGSEVLH